MPSSRSRCPSERWSSFWHLLAFGVVRQADEGAAARVYQLLMAAQVPIVAYFAITWLPRAPRQALQVLALQVGAALLTLAPLFLLGLRIRPRWDPWRSARGSRAPGRVSF